MNIKSIVASASLISVLLLSGCGGGSEGSTPPPPTSPAPAPAPNPTPAPVPVQNVRLDTTVTTINGENIRVKATDTGYILEGYEGKVVFLELYSTTCPHCIDAIPMYNSLQAKYGDRLVVLSLEASGVSTAALRDFAASRGITYKTAAAESSQALINYVMSNGGYQGGVPFLTVVDTNGNTYAYYTGDVAESTLENMIIDLTN